MSEKITKAIKVITEELEKDKSPGSYYHTWQANIAMAFYDELCIYEFGSRVDIEKSEMALLCNRAANRFLNLLINTK